MKRFFKKILIVFLFTLIIISCQKYLELQPDDKYTEEQIYSNENSIIEVLNGLYGCLSDNSLYGANLSTTTIELLGQRYIVYPNSSYRNNLTYPEIQGYDFSNNNVLKVFEEIWTQAYSTIIQSNNFIRNLDKATQKGVITNQKASLLKGEAIAIRALLHFDLLRLYGPVFITNSTQKAIPYYSKADAKPQPILPANQILDSILNDLSVAATLLANDPVKTNGVVTSTDFYSGYRNQRLNYFAVKTLQARALLYGGKNSEAYNVAKLVLEDCEKWFPWLDYTNIVSEKINPDRIFSPEVLFGVYNPKMYSNFSSFFSSDLITDDLLTSEPERLINTFENNENDYRYTTTWLNTAKGRTFHKFADIEDKTKQWRFIQPLIRKTEIYYILAETEPNPTAALNYLNTALYNRGLTPLANVYDINSEILKEYQKEFYGEGQIFFYYKRLNLEYIPSGTMGYSWDTVNPEYVVPIPLSETTPR